MYVVFFGTEDPTFEIILHGMTETVPFNVSDVFDAIISFKEQNEKGVIIIDDVDSAPDDFIVPPAIHSEEYCLCHDNCHIYLFSTTEDAFERLNSLYRFDDANYVFVSDMTKEQSFELLGKYNITDDAVKQEIYDYVGGMPGYLKMLWRTDTAESRQAVYDDLNGWMSYSF